MKKKLLLFNLLFSLTVSLPAQNLISPNSWTVGSGSVGIFSQNGASEKNVREWGITPNGTRGIVWKGVPDASGYASGGFNTSIFPIDHTKMYRFSIWIKKTNSNDGHTYLGCYGNSASGSNLGVKTLSGGTTTNAYFYTGDLPQLNKWYLLIGYVHGSGDNSTTHLGGIYDGVTGRKVVDITDFKFIAGTTHAKHRSYLYYDSNTSDRQYFYAPRVDLVSGDEPSIDELLPDLTIVEASSVKTLDIGWYTIAKNSGNRNRASAKFSMGEGKNGYHTAVHFYAQHHYGKEYSNRINVLANSTFGSNKQGAFRKIRIIEGSTYAGALLQIEIDQNGTNECYFEITENIQDSGWELVDWELEDNVLNLPNGETGTEVTTIDLDVNNGMILSNDLWVGNEIVVDGDVVSEEVRVEVVNPPDYVFDPAYNLPSLKETEAFIKANHHLPEVPSATAMQANGIELGKMNMLLLQKIEELTLHQIEQNKKIELLLQKVTAQEKEITNLKNKN